MDNQLKEEIIYKDTLNLPQTNFPMKGDGPKHEPEIQKFWFENKIYEKALDNRKNSKNKFLLHDGPPYLSSPAIHIGTALNKILKDIVVKYKTLRGYYSPYLPGFDCHGLPIESAVLKEKALSTQHSALSAELSPLDIRKKCVEFVLKNRQSQEEKFKRLGVLGDWQNAYMTINPKFEARQLKLFGEMVDKGYIYRGLKPVFWCPVCQTALAEAEVEYVDNHKSPSIYVSFKVIKLAPNVKKLEKYLDLKVIIWTTTPWTIPGNLAICLHKDFDYVVVDSKKHGYLLLACALLPNFCEKISEHLAVVEKLKGKDLEYSVCKHPLYERESSIILGEHVTLETGTGCVHTAPGHGLEDFTIGQKYGLKIISPVDSKGLLTEEAGNELKGLYVHKSANQKVTEMLENAGALISHEDYYHSYPHCWRSKTPIIFRATEQWFCSVEKFRKEALAEIDNVRWIPPVGKNRIYSMVETRTDWCISRQRVWGVPIVAFYCTNCSKVHLNKAIVNNVSNIVEENGSDVWWEKNISELLPIGYKCDCGSSSFIKEKDTMDVWFDSGSTHYSVVDVVNELTGIDNVMYLEGSDQHRGWFQSSLLTSVAVKNKAPYKYVLTHGFVLDEHGGKMSKSLGNVVDPQKVINEYGADILRLWVASVDYSSDMRIGQNMLKQLAEVYRNIRNTTRFILGNLYDFNITSCKVPYEKLLNIDKYLLHKLEILKKEITTAFDEYEFYRYYQLLQNFCSVDLSSFYFDLIKDRLYTAGKNSNSRCAAQTVLYEVLNVLIGFLCPVMPHLAEDIWKYLPSGIEKKYESVICLEWPLVNPLNKNESLASDLELLLKIKNLVYKALETARADKKIGKSLEARVALYPKSIDLYNLLKRYQNELPAIFIVSQVNIYDSEKLYKKEPQEYSLIDDALCLTVVLKASGQRCERCWKYSEDVGMNTSHKTICLFCVEAINL